MSIIAQPTTHPSLLTHHYSLIAYHYSLITNYSFSTMIKLKEKIGYGFGDMASSMFWKLFGSYLMIFYTDVFGLPAAVVGTMFLITRVWDSAFDPIVGIIADRTHSRWGKFRPWLMIGTLLNAAY